MQYLSDVTDSSRLKSELKLNIIKRSEPISNRSMELQKYIYIYIFLLDKLFK